MFDPRSRYHDLKEETITLPDGREVAFKVRRLLPPGTGAALGQEVVGPSDRLDLIAARALGDSEQFWRICDANQALDPYELLVEGRRLTIPTPLP